MAELGARLRQAWQARGWLPHLLWPVAQAYAGLSALRRQFYRWGVFKTESLPCPVVVVGNVVAGGAGKTPLVMAVVAHLQAAGKRPGVISRGYGRRRSDCLKVQPSHSAHEVGDEPLLIVRKTGVPVVVAARRIEAAKAVMAEHPDTDVLVCDDGLQHYALARDVNIAVFDDRGAGNGWLLPAGPLREAWPPRARAAADPLRGVDLVLHSGQNPAFAGFRSTRQLADHAVSADGRQVALASLRGQGLHAWAGIAKPEEFFSMLRAKGLTLAHTQALSDHHDFADGPVPDPSITVLCTEKDAVKLFALFPDAGLRLLAVPLVFSPEPAFWAALDAQLQISHLRFPHGHQTS